MRARAGASGPGQQAALEAGRHGGGLPGALTLAGLVTLFQRSSEDSHWGRVFGAVSALEGITVLAGTLGAGYMSRLAGIVPVLAI